MHRFFVSPKCISKRTVNLVGSVAHQIKNVLRMKPGRKIIVLDNKGNEYLVNLQRIAKTVVVGQIIETTVSQGEPMLRLSLYQGTLKAQRFEWVLQKGTELGISEFIPVICQRSILGDVESVDEKHARWERIIREAAEQCERGNLPELRPAMMFSQACNRAGTESEMSWLAWEYAEDTGLRSVLSTIESTLQKASLFIGSEGGFTLDEVRLADRYNISPIWLGKRILRAETASIVAASILFYQFGELE